MKLQEVEAELAKLRFEEHLPKKGEKGFQPISVSNEADTTTKGRTTQKVADKIGVKRATYERAKTVIEKAPSISCSTQVLLSLRLSSNACK